MKKCSTRILHEIKKHSESVFSDKGVAPRQETIDCLTQLARAYYVDSTVLPLKEGVVLN